MRMVTRLAALLLLFGVWAGVDRSWAQVAPGNPGIELEPDDPVSPVYDETLRERERQRLDEAEEGGGSFIPRFQGEMQVLPPSPVVREKVEEVAEEPEVRERKVRGLVSLGAEEPESDDRVGQFLESLVGGVEVVRIRYGGGDSLDVEEGRENEAARETEAPGSGVSIEPGRGVYGRTLYAVNSDFPGPVVLELLEPPLVGAIVTGSFTRAGTRMLLRFDRLSYRGESVPVEAWGVDLDCACYGVAGEVDRHWFARVVVPAALRFAEGFVGALGVPEQRIEVGGGEVVYERQSSSERQAVFAGIAAAGSAAARVLTEDAPATLTVRIPRDTEMVVVFQEVGRGGSAGGG